MRTTKLVRLGLTSLLCPMLAAGCLITTNSDDDGNSDASDTDQSETSFSSFSATNSSVDESSGSSNSESVDETAGETTVGPMGDCDEESLIVDGGFEAGTPSSVWMEASEQFGTPICDVGCTEDEGAEPYAGEWFAWFGGVADPENASVSQLVTIPPEAAYLGFRFQINAGAGTGDDVFTVTIDEQTVFMATDADIDDYSGYTLVSLDVSDFADGAEHIVAFSSSHPGTGLSNFFLDDIALVSCTEGGGSSSSSGSETTAADSSTGSGSTDTGTDSSSGDSGSSDSSSSTGM